MEVTIVVSGLLVAVAAAVRSTWSPCGQSMLAQLTPIGEAARGHRYRVTAGLYIVGALVGGATLGALMAGGAAAVALLDAPSSVLLLLATFVALAGALLDSGSLGVAPPFLRRQVNEDWLGRYRAWVYAGGFGWQIGVGITTYVMTAAVFVMIALGSLGGSPMAAFLMGVSFGLVRGCAVLLVARMRTPASLFAFHRRFDELGEPTRWAVVVVQLALAIVAATVVGGLVGGALCCLVALGIGIGAISRVRASSSAAPKTVSV